MNRTLAYHLYLTAFAVSLMYLQLNVEWMWRSCLNVAFFTLKVRIVLKPTSLSSFKESIDRKSCAGKIENFSFSFPPYNPISKCIFLLFPYHR